MQEDFHYYATYCAAFLAGYDHRECLDICYSAQFVDLCSKTLLAKLKAPQAAATTQLQLEMMDARTDILGLQDITRIWASFHFLPRDLYASKPRRTRLYMQKFRLICGPDGELVRDTVELARNRSLQSVGIAMHVLADTWAHANFAGTPSLVINNTTDDFFEILPDECTSADPKEATTWEDSCIKNEREIKFRHNPSAPDDPENGIYTNSLYQENENSIMNLGHGRAGHLPDYSFIKYRYLPAWNDYRVTIKDNPSDYYNAFCQMIYAMKYLRGSVGSFETGIYDTEAVAGYESRIREIIRARRLIASDDWKALGEELSGQKIEAFDINRYQAEYTDASIAERKNTFIGRFTDAVLAQKSMVSDHILRSGNILAGFAVNPLRSRKFRRIKND